VKTSSIWAERRARRAAFFKPVPMARPSPGPNPATLNSPTQIARPPMGVRPCPSCGRSRIARLDFHQHDLDGIHACPSVLKCLRNQEFLRLAAVAPSFRGLADVPARDGPKTTPTGISVETPLCLRSSPSAGYVEKLAAHSQIRPPPGQDKCPNHDRSGKRASGRDQGGEQRKTKIVSVLGKK